MKNLGIIGGADGPTAIFVAGKVRNPGMIGFGIGIVAAAAFLGICLLLKKKK